MILKITIVILVVIAIGIIVNAIEEIKKKNESKISFREAMDLVELPIVTFYNGSKKLNFLLDTGCTNSIINESVLPEVNYKETDSTISTFGMEGNSIDSSMCIINIYYRKNNFEDEFSIINMDEAFNRIKAESGVQIHGILGSKFFEKYKYVLDFKDLIAYMK